MPPSPSENLKASAALLTGVNLLCAGIGAAQGLVVVRLLGPEGYGAAAVLLSLTSVAANLIDVRLIDLVSNLLYSEDAARYGSPYRASALRLGIGLYAISAPLIIVSSGVLMWMGAGRFSTVAFDPRWFWIAAAAQGISYFGSLFIFVQRFVTTARRMAILQFASALINAAVMVSLVAFNPTIGGYVTGLLISAIGIAIINTIFAVRFITGAGIALFARPSDATPLIDRRVVFRFVAAGNALGYVKLLHRSADVLLVAFFCSDRDTGIYKLARSMTDALSAISEAVGRIYQPRLLALLQQSARDEYRAVARSIAASAAAITVAALVGVFAGVPYVATFLGWSTMPGLTLTTAVMTLPFFFVAGLQSWIWPAYVSMGRMGRCTLWGVVAVLAGQYTIGPLLTYTTGVASPVWFGVGFLSYYVLLLLPLWHELVKQGRTFRLTASEAAA